MTDDAIIKLYFARNESAIHESEAKYGAYCLTVAENILYNKEDAEECVNDTWMRAWNAIPPTNPGSLKLFFARIVRNLAFNKRRFDGADKRGGGELPLVLDELDYCIGDSSVEKCIEIEALTQSINSFLSLLDSRDRSIFIRRYFYVEPTSVIARRYALSSAHIRTVLSRTRKKLKKYLKEEGFTT